MCIVTRNNSFVRQTERPTNIKRENTPPVAKALDPNPLQGAKPAVDSSKSNSYNAHKNNPNQVNFQAKQETAKPQAKNTNTVGNIPQTIAAGGIFQELSYPVLKDYTRTPVRGKTSNFSLSFRDKSGFQAQTGQKPTSQVYLNRSKVIDAHTGNVEAPPNRWKGVRLDYGPNAKTGGTTNWHWNQSGAAKAFKATDGAVITDHKLATGSERALGRVARVARPLGRAAVVVGGVMDTYSLAREANQSRRTGNWNNTAVEGARIAGGWGGAYAGAKTLGVAGATIGAFGGPVGIAVGGAVGGIVGGIGGYWAGSNLARMGAESALSH